MRRSGRLHGKIMRMRSKARPFHQVCLQEINISSAIEYFTALRIICFSVCSVLFAFFFSVPVSIGGTPTLNMVALRDALRKEVSTEIFILSLGDLCVSLKPFRSYKTSVDIFKSHNVIIIHVYSSDPLCS
jgi:hypothetical protein